MNDLHQEIFDLKRQLGLVDGPTPAQAAVISKAITALEEPLVPSGDTGL